MSTHEVISTFMSFFFMYIHNDYICPLIHTECAEEIRVFENGCEKNCKQFEATEWK